MNVRCGKCMCAVVGVLASSLSSCGISSHTSSGAAAPSTVNIQTGRPLPTEPTTVANTISVATTVDIQSGGVADWRGRRQRFGGRLPLIFNCCGPFREG